MNEEYLKEQKMSYEQLCDYLKDKYGVVPGDYFTTPKCSTQNTKIKRGKEGLAIHHIKEYSFNSTNLGTKEMAKQFPYEYQKSINLVYCNYIEHCILHEKIYEYRLTQYIDGVKMEDGLTIFMFPKIKHWYQNQRQILLKDLYYFNPIKEDYEFFQYLYNNFYKNHPNAPKYGLHESKSVKKTGHTSRPKLQ